MVFLEHVFSPNAGGLYKLSNEEVTVLAGGLDKPAGLRVGLNGEVFVTLPGKGQVIKVESVTTDVEDLSPFGDIPTQFGLHQNYPNPFNPSTTIRYDLPEPTTIRLVVFDALGRVVETLVSGHRSAGRHKVTWEADQVPSGVYFVRMEVGPMVETRSMFLAK